MRNSTQGSLNATNQYGDIGVDLFQDFGINRSGIVGSETCLTPRRIRIVGTQTFVGGIVIHHRIHTASRYAKEIFWFAQFLEIPQIVLPVGLWNDGDFEALTLNNTPNHGSTEGRMVHVGIPRNQNNV